ncbi:MAG TPA: hypothetical protein PK008_12500, partial [Aminivibrio sp.]|uniref:hypothetical protein n=1 Tax=Aminivibrio sp. TaxID=1872489 RepID=UPI002C067D26
DDKAFVVVPNGAQRRRDLFLILNALKTDIPPSGDASGFVNANLITRDSRILTTPVILPRPPF